jgi:hypothetical protein
MMPDTFTANYNLTKPEVGGSRDSWGAKDNSNLDIIDGALKGLSDNKLDKAGGTVTGQVNFTGPVPQYAGTPAPTAGSVADLFVAGFNALIPRGMIMLWAGNLDSIPNGWIICNGTNGSPDMRDRFILGAGGANPVYGVGGAGTHNHGGVTGGRAITELQMPYHTHGIYDPGHSHGVNDPGHRHTYLSPPTNQGLYNPGGIGFPQGQNFADYTSSTTTGISIAGSASNIGLYSTGGGQPHNHDVATASNIPPFITLCYIMKT